MQNESITTSTARIWLGKDGVIRAVFHLGANDNLETAKENVLAGIKVSGGIRRPMVLDMTKLSSMNKAARDYYAGGDARKGVEKAVALVVNSPLSRIIGNFFLGFNKTTKPTKLFTSEEQALAWLKSVCD